MDDNKKPSDEQRALFLANLLAKRKEAVQGRRASGIEREWQEDEDHYQGIDDANRKFHASHHGHATKNWAEGQANDKHQSGRSVVFPNITRPYVDAASARVADMLLPTDDRSWEIRPTPLPRLDQAQIEWVGGEEAIEQLIAEAKEKALGMQREIDDCLIESNWHGEVRRVIEDAARLGTGVLKGPFPVRREVRITRKSELGQLEMERVAEIKPGTKSISCWNFFPDPACGDNIHNGSFTYEREFISRRQLVDMAEMPGYDAAAIAKAIKDGPVSRDEPRGPVVGSDDQYEMWIFHGNCDVEQLRALGVEVDDDEDDKLPAMAVLVNDTLVKVTLSVLETGKFPYDILAWQARPGMPWGLGVARQIRTAQRMLTGGARGMMDNAGLTAAPQIVFGNGIAPLDASWTLYGGKYWRATPDASAQDIRAAFHAFNVPSVQAEMMGVIDFALRMAEDTTGLPQMLQGIRGDAPDTLGGMQMQNNNASSVLRRLAKRFDDYLTRPHIDRYFDWMMQYSEDDSIKGDFQIQVRGSSALVERDAQQQFLLQVANFAKDPAYGLSPSRVMRELVKAQRLDPKNLEATEEEKQAQADAMSQVNPLDQARVGLVNEQANKTRAEAVNKNAEAMFSATQVVRNIAMSPELAIAADEAFASAGGIDANAGPAIPQVYAPEAAPPEMNTNPLTPANPATGMNAGIEGGGL